MAGRDKNIKKEIFLGYNLVTVVFLSESKLKLRCVLIQRTFFFTCWLIFRDRFRFRLTKETTTDKLTPECKRG